MNKSGVFQKMKSVLFFICWFLITSLTHAQDEITVDGIEGLTFTKKVESYTETVPDTFSLHLMKIVPDSLFLKWDADSTSFSLFGGAKVLLTEEEFYVSLGTEEEPGISIKNDALETVNFGFTASFGLKDITVIPDSLSFEWDRAEDNYDIYGAIKVDIEGDTLVALLGDSDNPGMEINDGNVVHVNIGISKDFQMKSLTIAPKELTLMWDEGGSYSIYGGIEIDVEGDTLIATLGDADDPGIEIKDGSVIEINIGITDDFTMKSVRIEPQNLTFRWDEEEDDFNISGSIEVDVDGDSMKAVLGDLDNPGIEIKDGAVDKIDIGITEDFKLKSLEIRTDSLGFAWQKEKVGDVFHLFGRVRIQIEEDEVGFSFGDMEHPGLVLEEGKITSLEIRTSADLHFGGMEVATEDLTVEHHEDEYHISGKLFIKEMWHALIDLGEGPGSGVTLDFSDGETKFKIEQATFELGEVDLGAISIKKMLLKLEDNRIVEDAAKIEFPPGWEIDADIKLADGSLEGIDIGWEAVSFEEAIELPGTGAFITKMEGGVENLNDMHNFSFEGKIGICFGGPFTIGEYEVSIVYLEADATISRSELRISSDIKVGAYMDEEGTWHSVLGDGNLLLDLQWGHLYSLSGQLNVPSSPNTMIKAGLEAQLSNTGAFNALIDVELVVPESVPLIGGHKFGEADGAVHYDKHDPSSFAAGWVSIDLFFDTIKKGVKYSFKNKDFSIIGASSIRKLRHSASKTLDNSVTTYWKHIRIEVDGDHMPHYMQIKVKLKQKFAKVFTDVYTTAMHQNYPYAPCYYVDGVDLMAADRINFNMLQTYNYLWSYNKNEIIFYVLPVGYDTNIKARLAAGAYWLEVGVVNTKDFMESYEVHKIYDDPKMYDTNFITNFVTRPEDSGPLGGHVKDLHVQFDIHSWVFAPDVAKITYFISKDGRTGIPIAILNYSDVVQKYEKNRQFTRKGFLSQNI